MWLFVLMKILFFMSVVRRIIIPEQVEVETSPSHRAVNIAVNIAVNVQEQV